MSDFDYARKTLTLSGGKSISYYSLAALEGEGLGDLSRVPKSVKILHSNL